MAGPKTEVSSLSQKVNQFAERCYITDQCNKINRDTVMQIMKMEDPHGCERRRKKTLKRRIYRNKVCIFSLKKDWPVLNIAGWLDFDG